MDINNMTKEQLLEELKNHLVECKVDCSGTTSYAFSFKANKSFSFTKGHWYRCNNGEGGTFFTDDNGTVLDIYDIPNDKCFSGRW